MKNEIPFEERTLVFRITEEGKQVDMYYYRIDNKLIYVIEDEAGSVTIPESMIKQFFKSLTSIALI